MNCMQLEIRNVGRRRQLAGGMALGTTTLSALKVLES